MKYLLTLVTMLLISSIATAQCGVSNQRTARHPIRNLLFSVFVNRPHIFVQGSFQVEAFANRGVRVYGAGVCPAGNCPAGVCLPPAKFSDPIIPVVPPKK